MVLGSMRGALIDKVTVVLHAFMLESGLTCQDLQSFCQQVCVATSDLGVEFDLSKAPAFCVRDVWPWYDDKPPEEGIVQADAEADGFDVVEHYLGLDARLSLRHMMAVPGILHIIHNASDDLLKAAPLLGESGVQLASLSTFLREPHTRSRLLEACFNGRVSSAFKKDFSTYRAKVNTGRWGSVAFACASILEIEKPLRRFWSMQNYLRIPQHHGAGGEDEDVARKQLKEVDEIIDAPIFWARMLVLNELFSLVRRCFWWTESCPCHGHLDRDLYPDDVVKEWDKCPLRGCRLPELASGCFFENFEGIYNMTAAQLLDKMPRDVDDAVWAECMREFEAGRTHLAFIFTLKLAAFQEAPLCLFAIGHYDEACSREAT